jgi:hypothetical protein
MLARYGQVLQNYLASGRPSEHHLVGDAVQAQLHAAKHLPLFAHLCTPNTMPSFSHSACTSEANIEMH